jgi:hypothetical protein
MIETTFTFESDIDMALGTAQRAGEAALTEIALLWLAKAILIAPVYTGILRASIGWAVGGTRQHRGEAMGSEGPVSVEYQAEAPPMTLRLGSNVEYAAAVHENLDPNVQWSARGTGPKFIERPLQENRAVWETLIRRRITEAFG